MSPRFRIQLRDRGTAVRRDFSAMAPKKKQSPSQSPSATSTPSAGGRNPPHQRGRQDGPDQDERSEAQSRQDQSAAEAVLSSSVPQQRSRFTDSESKLVEDMAMALKRRYGELTPEVASGFLLRGFGVTPISDAVGQSATADVSITGSSRAARAPDVSPTADESDIAATARKFIRDRFKFAATAIPYTSFPSPDGNRNYEDRLATNLRIALLDSEPNPATLSFALGETAQAAGSLIPGVVGERVCALIHNQIVSLTGALASIALRMGDAADVATLTRLIVRKVLRHLQNEGSDPAAFVRKELDELRITADMRLVKHSFAPAAAASPKSQASQHAGVSSSPGVQPPPGLGFAQPPTPFPPMSGLAGQTKNEKFRRWIRYPRDSSGNVIMAACMLCGQGSTAGSVGHRADACGATPQQQSDWINHALPVK